MISHQTIGDVAETLEHGLPELLAARPAPGSERRYQATADIRIQVHALRWARNRTMPGEPWRASDWLTTWQAYRCEAGCGRRAALPGGYCWQHRYCSTHSATP